MVTSIKFRLRPGFNAFAGYNYWKFLIAAAGFWGAIGCGSSDNSKTQSGSGGQDAVGGATGAGASGLGGSSNATSSGGVSATGGHDAAGGSLATGGISPAGGNAQTGGAPLTGGAVGTTTTGGSVAAGGTSAIGGAPVTGGRAATGGIGAQSGTTGGSTGAQGGSGTGGSNVGTGGTANGGAATGGAATGGAATGGATSTQPQLVTSTSGAYWTTSGTLTQVASGTATVTVTDSSAAQTWEGFGGAFNELSWTYLQMLSQTDRDRALQLLFGADGCRFAFGRIPMGSSDYATSRYTEDEVASGQTDPTMASFSFTRNTTALIPFIKAAQAVKSDIRFWSSPWTPPTWMKTGPFTTPATTPSNFDGGNMTDTDAILKANAQYFVKFVQGYAQNSITIEAVAPQNEPSYMQNYPSCVWTPALFTKFVGQYLGPAFTTAGLTTKIMLGTMSSNTKDNLIVSAVMGDATAKSYIKVLGYQWTMVNQVASAKSYNLPIWQTEHQCGNYPWVSGTSQTTAPNDQAYAVESWGLIRDWIKAGVSSYSAWNMVLDTGGKGIDTQRAWAQNALLAINTSSKTLILTPTYHVFRHFSQFVDPGAKVVATSGGDAVAFKNPSGSIVTVMYNSGAATTYRVSVGGKLLQFNMPGNGWATIVQ